MPEMPSVSPAQQHLMGMAYAYKRGELHDASPEVKKVASGMNVRQLRDFASTRGLAEGGIVANNNNYAAGGIAAPRSFHLMHDTIPKTPAPRVMSPAEGTPWWTRSEARVVDRPPRGFAGGGGIGAEAPWWERSEGYAMNDVPHGGGLIDSSLAGRTDRLPLAVGAESDVVPADVVSGLGQGNTKAGARLLTQALRIGPWGVHPPTAVHGSGPPHPPHPAAFAKGGDPHQVSILAAGGEAIIPCEDWFAKDEIDGKTYLHRGVRSIGGGDAKRGHELLHRMYKNIRDHTVKFIKNAAPPKK